MDDLYPNDQNKIHSTRLFDAVFRKGSYIGPYQVIEQVGKGGMARVYKAYHKKLERFVAIKVMDKQIILEEEHKRFVVEAKLTARLQHPSIVAVHDVGSALGLNYIVMDYIEGYSLQELIMNSKISIKQACHIAKEIALGLHYAHNEGVIHRDIKPSNIIITKHNRPIIMDFGLAKNTKGDQDITKVGMILGTPKYMAPEQIKGENKNISRVTDVYGLGAVFYEMLTKKPVITGETALSISYNILNKKVIPLRNHKAEIPQDIQEICLKALEKTKLKRYQSTNAMAEDIERYLNGKAIFARQENKLYLLQKKAIHHKTWFLIFLCLFFLVTNIVQFLLYMLVEKNASKKYNKISLMHQITQKKYADALSVNNENEIILNSMNEYIANNPQKSLLIINKLLSVKSDPRLYCYRASFFINIQKYKKALRDLNKSLLLDNHFSIAYFLRGKIYIHLKKNKQAIQNLRKYLKSNKNINITFLLCKLYFVENQYFDASKILEKMKKKNNFNYELHYLLAESYFKQKKYAKAFKEAEETIKLRDKHVSSYYILGFCSYFFQKWEKCIEYFNIAEHHDSTQKKNKLFMPFQYFRGIALKKLGLKKKSFSDFQKGIRFFTTIKKNKNKIYYRCLLERARLHWINKNYNLAMNDYNILINEAEKLLESKDKDFITESKKKEANNDK